MRSGACERFDQTFYGGGERRTSAAEEEALYFGTGCARLEHSDGVPLTGAACGTSMALLCQLQPNRQLVSKQRRAEAHASS